MAPAVGVPYRRLAALLVESRPVADRLGRRQPHPEAYRVLALAGEKPLYDVKLLLAFVDPFHHAVIERRGPVELVKPAEVLEFPDVVLPFLGQLEDRNSLIDVLTRDFQLLRLVDFHIKNPSKLYQFLGPNFFWEFHLKWRPRPDLNWYELLIRGFLCRHPFCFMFFQIVSLLAVFEKKSVCHVSKRFKMLQIPSIIFEKFSRNASRKRFSKKRLFTVFS